MEHSWGSHLWKGGKERVVGRRQGCDVGRVKSLGQGGSDGSVGVSTSCISFTVSVIPGTHGLKVVL